MLQSRSKLPHYKVAVVGAGHMGRYHIGAYAEIPNVEFVAACDTDAERIKEQFQAFELPICTDYRDLIGKVDAVSIAVPTHLHFQVAKEFLEAGIHVLVEKPITPSLEEASELFELAEKKGCQLHIGHVERFNAAVLEIKNIVEEPHLIETRRLGPFTGRITDAGVVLDLLIHDIDIVQNLIGRKITKLSAMGNSIKSDMEDFVSLQMQFEGGCVASLLASRVTEQKSRTLVVHQKDAYVLLDYTDQSIEIHRQASSSYRFSSDQLRYKQESLIERIFVHKENPLRLELQHFLDCCAGLATRMTTVKADLRSLRVAIEVLDHLREQNVVS